MEKPTATHPPKVTVRRRIDADHGPVWRVECPRCHWWTNRATHWTAISMAHGHRCAPPWPPVPKRQRSGRGWW